MLALLLLVSDYNGGNKPLQLEAGFNVGAHWIGLGSTGFRNSFTGELRAGLRVTQAAAIELGVGVMPNGLHGQPQQLVVNPHGDFTYDFMQERIRPYAGAGIGVIAFAASEAGMRAPLFEGHIQAGLKIGLTDCLALRFEIKMLMNDKVTTYANAWPQYVSGLFTIGLMFAGTPAPHATQVAVAPAHATDSDGDGVMDDADECPNEKGSNSNGCPMISVQVDKVFLGQHARFEKGEAVIAADYKPALDTLAKFMKDHPEIKKMGVYGHTDIEGNRQHNQDLSEARAKAVVDYLVSKGVEPSRLHAKGFGQDRPLASNKSAIGKERNRRVEFVILQKD